MELKEKTMTQYCLDTRYLLETLANVPKTISIESLSFRIGSPYSRQVKRVVPNRLRKMGVSYILERPETVEYAGQLVGLSKTSIVKAVREICSQINSDIAFVTVRMLILKFKNSSASFRDVTKEIRPDETDQRRKLKVLGMTTSEGNVAALIKELSAKKYSCTFQRVFTTHIICSQLK